MATNNDENRAALLTCAFAVAGTLKLLGLERRLFRRWGLSTREMKLIGAAEAGGAALVANESTRGLGAAALAIMSLAMLRLEARNGDALLAVPRTALMVLAGLTAVSAGRTAAEPPRQLPAPRAPA